MDTMKSSSKIHDDLHSKTDDLDVSLTFEHEHLYHVGRWHTMCTRQVIFPWMVLPYCHDLCNNSERVAVKRPDFVGLL